jgi:son of sevenless-like protein
MDDDILESEDAYIFQRMKEFASTEAVVGLPAAKQLISHIEQMVCRSLHLYFLR